MRKVIRIAAVLIVAAAVLAPMSANAQRKRAKPLIQMAILLDTSNSMDGLINQAKAQLWKIVNEFALAKRDGERPDIQVALYEYGNDGLSASGGYIRQVLRLTTDLDMVSEKLFALKTNGGSEYCGQVIKVAGKDLDWSSNSNDLKVIVIAGNEPFTQGPVDYKGAVKGVIAKGVIVNTIHCGPYQTGVDTGWKDGAVLADGKYMNIDQDRAVVHIDAPQDKDIARLGAELNTTYIPYGSGGGVAWARQSAEDGNAASMSVGSSVNRAVFKSMSQYDNDGWDLVDAVKNDSVKLEEVEGEALPENMRKMNTDERKKYVKEMQDKRKKLQAKIRTLDDERKKFVADKRKESDNAGEDSFDSAMIKSMRKQAVDKSFQFE